MPSPRVRATVARRWYWPVVTAAALGSYALFGDRLRDEYRVTTTVELLTPERTARVGSAPNPFDTDALAGVVGQRLRTPEQLAVYRAAGLSDDTTIGLDDERGAMVIAADHPDEAVAAATVDQLVEDARMSLASVQLAMGVGDDRTVAMGATSTSPTTKVLSERRTVQLGVAAGALWLTTAIAAAFGRHRWSKRRKRQQLAARPVDGLAVAQPAPPPLPTEAVPAAPPGAKAAGALAAPAAPTAPAARPPATPAPRRAKAPAPPPAEDAGRSGPVVAPGPDGRLPMQPVPRSATRQRGAPARGPVRSTPTSGAAQPPDRALPAEPRTIDGGYRPTAGRPTTGQSGEPGEGGGTGEAGAASTVDEVIDLRAPIDALDDSPPVHPGRRATAALDEPLTLFSSAASWPGQQGPSRQGATPPESLFGAPEGERAPVPSGGAQAAPDNAGEAGRTAREAEPKGG